MKCVILEEGCKQLNVYIWNILSRLITNCPLDPHAPLDPGVYSVVCMLKTKECGCEGKFKLIEEFAKNTKLKLGNIVTQPVQL